MLLDLSTFYFHMCLLESRIRIAKSPRHKTNVEKTKYEVATLV